jgi:hypothetical protein
VKREGTSQPQIIPRLRRINPRNTKCIHMVKILAFLDLGKNPKFHSDTAKYSSEIFITDYRSMITDD